MQNFKSKLKASAFSLLFLTFAFCFLTLGFVQAQQVSLSISPPLLEVVIKPGKSILVAYTLDNFGDPTGIKTKVRPFEPTGNIGNTAIKDDFEGPIQFSLDNADLRLDQSYFLRSRERQQILLRMRIPEGAPEGDYYYTLLNETQPPPVTEGISSPRAQAAIGSHILITVSESGKLNIEGKITTFDVSPTYVLPFFGKKIKIVESSDMIPVRLSIENKGKNMIKPSGEIVLKGNLGEKATYSILSQNVLSQSRRVLTATPSATIDCDSKSNRKLCQSPSSLLLRGFFIGVYKLSATLSFGEGTPNLYASTSFVALPLKLTLGLIIILIIGIIIIVRMRRLEE